MAHKPISQHTLSVEINASTRTLHTDLNRLITSRLPLAIPPYADSPHLYATGLLHFAHIYLTFESLWADLMPSHNANNPSAQNNPSSPLLSFLLVDPWDADPDPIAPPSPHILEFLRNLRPRGLARSPRLKRDLEALLGLSKTDLEVALSQFPGQKVAETCQGIRKSVRAKPHVLVAYAWCFYMAVFSGGRWIRSELGRSGEGFWRACQEGDGAEKEGNLEERGLGFWYFDGDDDGEDLKREFKGRLEGADTLFTTEQREDVVEEAKEIFKFCAELVFELDQKLGTDFEKVVLVQNEDRVRRAAERALIAEKAKEADGPRVMVDESIRAWLKRPELTGVLLALGGLAWVVVFYPDAKSLF